ncbi:putative dehydrogenase [Pseudomonas savastanoi]|uniref:Putative dehydrogenase n=1 Tax=Pseudomonas savastanoi TaxID=29438 RepID=A0A3M5FW10_PSESS|nr:putative dehydrogenase [Pseudomonas savastanoi]
MDMVGIAVLGAGRIGKIHAANVALSKFATLVAVADPFADAAARLAGELGAEAMTDCEAAIDRPDVAAIVIGTPTHTHINLMLRAVRQGSAV